MTFYPMAPASSRIYKTTESFGRVVWLWFLQGLHNRPGVQYSGRVDRAGAMAAFAEQWPAHTAESNTHAGPRGKGSTRIGRRTNSSSGKAGECSAITYRKLKGPPVWQPSLEGPKGSDEQCQLTLDAVVLTLEIDVPAALMLFECGGI
jgi:hypothetical protein